MVFIIHDWGTDIGYRINAYRKGNGWVASMTNDKISVWYEEPLPWWVKTRRDVIRWAHEFIQDVECGMDYEYLRCELTIE